MSKRPLEIVLISIATIVTVSIFLKAIIDADTNYDTLWYHLPFAARIWGIIPEEAFTPESIVRYRFDGFPLLAQFLQGFFWRITGRVQTTNLVGFFSLIIYFVFLKTYFRVPLYLSAIAIFAIPAVLTHAAVSLVDLPGNVGVSILVMMTYVFFKQKQLPTKQELIIAFLGAFTAANIKPQLQPLVFLIVCIVGMRLIWLYFRQVETAPKQLLKILLIAILAAVLIFATPVKNIALYGNPFYPIKIEIAGIVLNHELTPETYKESNRPQKWLQSILEINTPAWSVDQWNQNNPQYLDRGGGFFGAYVIFNLLLLVGLAIKELLHNKQLPPVERSIDARIALIIVGMMSLFIANFPQSHELRYFMFWMIFLVSLNLYLISCPQTSENRWRWLSPQYIGLVYLLFLIIVLIKIDSFYIRPVLYRLDQFMSVAVKPELLGQIQPNERVCIISKNALVNPEEVPFAAMQHVFLYSSYFHPELDYSYSIQAVVNPKDCGKDRKIIPSGERSK